LHLKVLQVALWFASPCHSSSRITSLRGKHRHSRLGFSGAELTTFIEQANYVAVNDYESQMLQDKTGLDLSTIALAQNKDSP
jgi:hypothetical protein